MQHSNILLAITLTIFIGLVLAVSPAYSACDKPIEANAFGRPIDYNSKKESKNIKLVETYHFTPEVEALLKGKSSDRLEMELDYTLRQIPNHYRALNAMAKWQMLHKEKNHEFADYSTAKCYFERALWFKPNDPVLHMLKGIYFHRKGDRNIALQAYKKAVAIDPNYSEANYNLGLLYFDMGKYKEARHHAGIAYKNNFPLLGLRNKLEKIDLWKPK